MDTPKNSVSYTMRELSASAPWWRCGRVHLPGIDVLTLFCLILIGVHTWIEWVGGLEHFELLYTQVLGLSSEGAGSGRLWQFLTYSLLHGNWFHLLSNVFIIWVMGGRLLVIIGQKKLALTMLLSGLGGGVVFVLFDLASGVSRPLVGASGIAFGLFSLMAMLDPLAKVRPIPVSAKNMMLGVLLSSLFLSMMNPSLGVPVFESAGQFLQSAHFGGVFRVAHGCHLGGILAGIYMSVKVMGKLVTLEELRKQRIE